MYRKLGLIVGSSSALLLLAGCGQKVTVNCPVEPTSIERFSLCLTDGWTHETERFGEEGSFVVSIKANTGTGVAMRMHVKKDPLEGSVFSSIEFAERAIDITRQRAPHYKAVSTEPMMVGNKETILHIFDASESEEGEPVRYYQFVTTNDEIAYGFTAVISPNVDENGKETLLAILKSVTFVNTASY
jgi:hypothetical protein